MCHFLYYRICCYASDSNPYGTSILPALRAILDLTTREGTISISHSVNVGDACMKYISCYGTAIFIIFNPLFRSKMDNSSLGSINPPLLQVVPEMVVQPMFRTAPLWSFDAEALA